MHPLGVALSRERERGGDDQSQKEAAAVDESRKETTHRVYSKVPLAD